MTDLRSDRVELRCARCGRKNRVLRARLGEGPICGICHAALLASGPLEVNEARWASDVEQSPLPVLVDFWAPWCGPCRAVAPVLDQVAAERAGTLRVAKVNIDDNPRLAARFSIQAVPTLLLVRGGRVVDEVRGALPKPALEAWLARHL